MTLLQERVVLVAGAGPGLGRALATRIVEHGGRVALTARSADRIDRLADELGDSAVALPADLRDRQSCERVICETAERFGRIDGLVYNAAVIPPLRPVLEWDQNDIREAVSISVEGSLSLIRACTPLMRAGGGGSVVLVGSAIVRHPKPGFGAYSVGKHAALGLARSLALELGPSRIRVNTLAVGKIDGDRLQTYLAGRATEQRVPLAEVQAQYVDRIALRRLPDPIEYADVAIFLLSDLSRSITGHCLDANGGEYFD